MDAGDTESTAQKRAEKLAEQGILPGYEISGRIGLFILKAFTFYMPKKLRERVIPFSLVEK